MPFLHMSMITLWSPGRSWLNESKNELDPEILDVLRDRNVVNVLLDGPGQPVTKEETASQLKFVFCAER